MDDTKYTILYATEEGMPYEVLGSYTAEVAWELVEEYERSGLLVQYQPHNGNIRIHKPVSVQIAKVVFMCIHPTPTTSTSEACNQ